MNKFHARIIGNSWWVGISIGDKWICLYRAGTVGDCIRF